MYSALQSKEGCFWQEYRIRVEKVLEKKLKRRLVLPPFYIEGAYSRPAQEYMITHFDLLKSSLELTGSPPPLSWPQPSALSPDEPNVFRKEGDYWTIRYQDQEIRLKDSKGLHDIVYLLARPGKDIHVLELLGNAGKQPLEVCASLLDRMSTEQLEEEDLSKSGLGDAGPVLDDEAVADYKRSLAEYREKLTEAEQNNDIGRVAKFKK